MKLRCHELSITIPTADGPRWLLRGLDCEFESGLTAIIGPNGSGKTTLLRTLAGLFTPEEGRVELDGEPILGMDRGRRARTMAYLPQSSPVSHDLAVHALVMLGRVPYLPRLGGPSRQDHARVGEALESVGVANLGDRRLSSLSGGERQRVMLARMLATEAPVLVLDEPTTALDIKHGFDVLDLCHSLGEKGRTVVVSIHDLTLARRYAARCLCLVGDTDGTVHEGAAEDILRPEVLSDVFGVRMRLQDGDLVFAPRSDEAPR